MRVAAFGDIHSNSVAFESAVKKAEDLGMDACLLLGDYVTDCAYPEKTLEIMERLKAKYPTHIIRGNREEYLYNHLVSPCEEWRYGSRTGSLLYTFHALSEDTIRMLAAYPITKTVFFPDAPPIEMVHGTFDKTRAMLLPGTEECTSAAARMQTGFLACAHTHTRFVCEANGKIIANGGPVGVPSGGVTGACFLMLESSRNHWKPSLHIAPYDTDLVEREFRESGFYDKAKYWARGVMANLKTGEDYTLHALRLVHKLSEETGLSPDNELLWERAAGILKF